MESQAWRAYSLRSSTSPMCATSSHSMRRTDSAAPTGSEEARRRRGRGGPRLSRALALYRSQSILPGLITKNDQPMTIVFYQFVRSGPNAQTKEKRRRRRPLATQAGETHANSVRTELASESAGRRAWETETGARPRRTHKRRRPDGNRKVPSGRGDEPSERPTPGSRSTPVRRPRSA